MSRRLLRLGICVIPWLVLIGATNNDDPKTWNVDKWAKWRDIQIKQILLPEFNENGERIVLRGRVVSQSDAAYSFLKPFLKDPKFLQEKHLGNFARFVSTLGRMNTQDQNGIYTNLLALDLTDREYAAKASRYVAFPDLLSNQSFLNRLSRPTGYRAAVGMIERQNLLLPSEEKWIVQPFRAQFVKSADETTYGRLLVLVPNQKLNDGRILDRWFMFALATPNLSLDAGVRSVSVIAVIRDPAKPGENQSYLCDFMRDRNPATGEIQINSNFLLAHSPSKNCYDCHKSAVLPIHPKNLYEFDVSGQLVEAPESTNSTIEQVNKLVFQYGRTDFIHIEPESLGPTLGTVSGDRSDAFIALATKDAPIPIESYKRIRDAMSCANCHTDFARLNYPLAVRSDQETGAFEAKKGLIQSTIELGIMPPKNDLNEQERTALWKCLMKEYLDLNSQKGTFIDWLKGG